MVSDQPNNSIKLFIDGLHSADFSDYIKFYSDFKCHYNITFNQIGRRTTIFFTLETTLTDAVLHLAVEIIDSFSCSFWGHHSENWTKNRLPTAEAKFFGNSAKAIMALQKLNHKATVIKPPIDECLWLPSGSRCFQSTYQQKRLCIFQSLKRPSVIHAGLGITAITVKAHFQ